MTETPSSDPSPSRWSWGQYPTNRLDGARMVIPLGCMHTPLGGDAIQLPYEPLKCVCGGILNFHCPVEHRSKTWECVFCLNRNTFPPHYANMTEHCLPAELMPQYTTVEYSLPAQRPAPSFFFVVDTCVDTAEEVEHLRKTLLRAIARLPEYANVTFITFGATVQLHDLSGATEYPRTLVFRGNDEVTVATIRKLVKKPELYAAPMSQVEFTLTTLIEELAVDCWPVARDTRPLRCTGAALSVAASFAEVLAPNVGSGLLAFLSGICTIGPGQNVDVPKAQMIRTHVDVRDNLPAAKYWDSAHLYYDTLMRRLVKQGHALHVFSACLDQVGLAEMKLAIQATGGIVVASDGWKKPQVAASIDQFLKPGSDGALDCGLNATFDVATSPTWKVCGVIGQCIGTGRKSSSVADTEIGFGGTCQWTSSFIDSHTTLAVYFETVTVPPQQPGQRRPNARHVQFVTKYQRGSTNKIRVTTLAHQAMEQTNFQALGETFDQETAAVLLARHAVHKIGSEPVVDVLRWLDRHIVRLVNRFGDFVVDQPQSLRLSPKLSMFPIFMFNLRRSAYLQLFNRSPDETAVLRLMLLKGNSSDCIVMIQPTLTSYAMQGPPQPVLLDVASVKPDTVLLLDTFFEILIHHGENIKAWRLAGYETNPDFAHFKAWLDGVRSDQQAIAAGRFPAPRLMECGQGDPDSRYLYNVINPSRTHHNAAGPGQQQQYGANPGELCYTDDASLQKFMDHLKEMAVKTQP